MSTTIDKVHLLGDFYISYSDPSISTSRFWVWHKDIVIRQFEFGDDFDACVELIRSGVTRERVIEVQFGGPSFDVHQHEWALTRLGSPAIHCKVCGERAVLHPGQILSDVNKHLSRQERK